MSASTGMESKPFCPWLNDGVAEEIVENESTFLFSLDISLSTHKWMLIPISKY